MAFNLRYTKPTGETTTHERRSPAKCSQCADLAGTVVWNRHAKRWQHRKCRVMIVDTVDGSITYWPETLDAEPEETPDTYVERQRPQVRRRADGTPIPF